MTWSGDAVIYYFPGNYTWSAAVALTRCCA
jgi:hypothetical protein